MKLKEKFENNIIGINGEIKIADDYAIEFANWIFLNGRDLLIKKNLNTGKELLEIYKKEKGL